MLARTHVLPITLHQAFLIMRRLLSIIPAVMLLCSCFGGLEKPAVRDIEPDDSYNTRMHNISLSKNVVMEGAKAERGYYFSKTVDVMATSKFGKHGEIADLGCVADGIHIEAQDATIIPAREFWRRLNSDTNSLNISDLVDGQYAHILGELGIDYLAVAFHQLVDKEFYFQEFITVGIITDTNYEYASIAVIDISKHDVVGAIEVDAEHVEGLAHTLFVIPIAVSRHPDEDLCQLIGRHAGKAVIQSSQQGQSPIILILAAEDNPYYILSLPPELSKKIIKVTEAINVYCADADSGNAEARKHIGDIYYHGIHGVDEDPVLAYVWYRLAADSGSIEASKQLNLLVEELSQYQSDLAIKKLLNWEPGQCQEWLSSTLPK